MPALVTTINPQTADVLVEMKYHDGSAWSSLILVQAERFRAGAQPARTEEVSADNITTGPTVNKNSRLITGQIYVDGVGSLAIAADLPFTMAQAVAVAVRYKIGSGGGTSTSSIYYCLEQTMEMMVDRQVPALRVTFQGKVSALPPELTAASFS